MDKNNSEWNYGFDMQDAFNPIAQYEQGYAYYKFLTQQVEYKIKCKELERLMNGKVG